MKMKEAENLKMLKWQTIRCGMYSIYFRVGRDMNIYGNNMLLCQL